MHDLARHVERLAGGELLFEPAGNKRGANTRVWGALEAIAKGVRGSLDAPTVEWDRIGERAEEQGNLAKRFASMLDDVPTNVICARPCGEIDYFNPSTREAMTRLGAGFALTADQLLGRDIGDFLSFLAEHRSEILSDALLPLEGELELAGETIAVLVSAIYTDGVFDGPMVTWEIVTEKRERELQIKEGVQREQQATAELRECVDKILVVVQAAGEGDLTRRIELGRDDAIGLLGLGLDGFFAELRGSLAEIGMSARQLASASEELSVTSSEMGENANVASSSADMATHEVNVITESVRVVAEGTAEMNASIQEIASSAERASHVAQTAVRSAHETSETMKKLNESGNEIGQVIQMITSIAEQTSLLALNATIEAARAGESGRGFAVVATEVKELATQTASATENIASRVGSIQASTAEAVDSINHVVAVIDEIGDASGTIASAVQQQSSTTEGIRRRVTETVQATGNIQSTIGKVTLAATGTQSGSEETQAAAFELAQMAETLSRLVARFEV